LKINTSLEIIRILTIIFGLSPNLNLIAKYSKSCMLNIMKNITFDNIVLVYIRYLDSQKRK
jgi:hypothetical protein